MRHRPPRPCITSLVLLALFLPVAALAVPPVPGKQGPRGPREGFSTAHLRPDFADLPQRGERLALAPQANLNVLAVRVAFSDTPIDSSTAYYSRLLFFMNQYWSQVTDGAVTLNPTLWDSVYTLPRPMSYYGDDDHFQERLVFMVRGMTITSRNASYSWSETSSPSRIRRSTSASTRVS